MSEPEKLVAGRYRLVRQVGAGGMGVVWEAWDERLERRVAVKRLRLPPGLSDAEAELANRRAMREARITGRLHHRNAVAVFDVVDDEGTPSLIMQFLSSITLAAVLREGGPLQLREAAQVGAEVASALSAAHGLGIVHRDVKPGNILIADDGSALISDFGISHALGDITITATGLVHGTLAYLSPEAARGEQGSFASDVFSLGATLYAALEGAPPFGTDSNSMALLHRIAAGTFEPPRHGGAFTPLLLDMLSPNPLARPSMREAANAMAGITTGATAETVPTAVPPTSPTLADLTPGPSASSGSEAAEASPDAETPAPAVTEVSPVEWARHPLVTAAPSAPPIWEGASAQSPARNRRAARRAGLVAALVVVGTLIALLGLPRLGGPGLGSVAQPPAASTTPGSPPAPASTPAASRPPTSSVSAVAPPPASARPSSSVASPTPQESVQATSEPRQSPSTAPSPTRPPVSDSPTTAELAEAITSYYSLMPEDTDQGWPRMTSSYQTDHTGGRRSYERFWGQIRKVTLKKVTATLPGRVRATVTYHYKSGRVDTEPTVYELVADDGTLKINKSTVLSSSTR